MIKNIEDFHQKISHNSEENIWNWKLKWTSEGLFNTRNVWKKILSENPNLIKGPLNLKAHNYLCCLKRDEWVFSPFQKTLFKRFSVIKVISKWPCIPLQHISQTNKNKYS